MGINPNQLRIFFYLSILHDLSLLRGVIRCPFFCHPIRSASVILFKKQLCVVQHSYFFNGI